MSPSAHVTSVEELSHFRSTFIAFVDAAGDSLLLVDMELRRFIDWLRHEQPRVLHQQRMACVEEIAQARSALNRKRIGRTEGHEPDVIEEQKALRRAQQKLEFIEERIANVKRWSQMIEPVVDDYVGQARQLSNLIEGDPPRIVGFLDAAIKQLQSYMELQAPSTGESISGGQTVARSATTKTDSSTEADDESGVREDADGQD